MLVCLIGAAIAQSAWFAIVVLFTAISMICAVGLFLIPAFRRTDSGVANPTVVHQPQRS
jgi:hypothetical protein